MLFDIDRNQENAKISAEGPGILLLDKRNLVHLGHQALEIGS